MRLTVGWSSMTRILGALRTSGSVTLAARKSIQWHIRRIRRPPGPGPARYENTIAARVFLSL